MRRGRWLRRALLPSVAVLPLLALTTGCGSSNPYSLPEYDPAAAVAPAATASAPAASRASRAPAPTAPPPTAVKYAPADVWGQGAWVERGRINAPTAEQRAVADAVTRYVSLRVQLSNTWLVDEPALVAAAEGQAVTSARERAEAQRARARRSIGRFVVNLSTVAVTGATARVSGCDFDATSEVDGHGRILVPPVGGVLITMQLHRKGTTWRVLDWPPSRVPTCDWRS